MAPKRVEGGERREKVRSRAPNTENRTPKTNLAIIRRRRAVGADVDGAEPGDGFGQALFERDSGGPGEAACRERDVRLSLGWVVLGQVLVDKLRLGVAQADDRFGQLVD